MTVLMIGGMLASCERSQMSRAEGAKTPEEIALAYVDNLKNVKDKESADAFEEAHKVLKKKANDLSNDDKGTLLGLLIRGGAEVQSEHKRIKELGLHADYL